jgi:hypothetical protein
MIPTFAIDAAFGVPISKLAPWLIVSGAADI